MNQKWYMKVNTLPGQKTFIQCCINFSSRSCIDEGVVVSLLQHFTKILNGAGICGGQSMSENDFSVFHNLSPMNPDIVILEYTKNPLMI